MKKVINRFCFMMLGLLTLVSCEREQFKHGQDEDRPTGTVNLSSLKISVHAEDEPEDTRAGIVLDNFQVSIEEVTSSGNKLVRSWKYSEMPEVFTLPVGNYRVVAASAADEPEATFNTGFWKGEQQFSIVADSVTDVETVTCKFSSIKVIVTFSDDLKKLLGNDVHVAVCVDGCKPADFTPEEKRPAYLKATSENNVLKARLTGTVDGQKVDDETAFPNVKAGEFRAIKYNLKSVDDGDTQANGTLGLNLSLDASCEIIEEGITVNPGGESGVEDFPGDGEPVDPEKPGKDAPSIVGESLKGQPFDIRGSYEIEGQCELKVKLLAPLGLAHVHVTIDSETLTEEILTDVGLSKKFDLAEPGSLEAGLSGLGFPVGQQVINQKELTFDLTAFTSLLGIYGAAKHKFIINVIDVKNNSVTETLTLSSK